VFSKVLNESVRNPRPKISSWSKTLELLKGRQKSIGKALVDVQVALRKARAKKSVIQRRLSHLTQGRAKTSRSAEVSVDCRKAKSVDVRLSYVVPGARWSPEYDLDFSARGKSSIGPGQATLTVSAIVAQSSGEDWTNVELLLSTSKPKLGASAPYPAPLYVDGQAHKRTKVLVQAHEKRAKLKSGAAAPAGQPRAAGLEDKGQSFVLRIPRRVTVASDGRPYWIPVDVVRTKAQVARVTIPKLDRYVYQLVTLNNPAPYPLLAGRVHSYRRGNFVGRSHLEYRGPGEPMEISLGIDEEVKVKREPIERRNRKAGLLSSNKHIDHAYRITLVNRAAQATRVEVRESIPVSKIEDVTIKLSKKRTTAGYDLDAERGFMIWNVRLAKKQDKQIDLAYTIDLPDDWNVNIR
jgi:uncharacterized protein (TIGR02231 family)